MYAQQPDTSGPSGLAGRTFELSTLRTTIANAATGHGRIVLLTGEPGIGKTRLAEEVSADARAAGFLVCWGRSWEAGGAPAYWPWIQLLRECSVAAPELGDPPALLEAPPGSPLGRSLALGVDTGDARFGLFDSIAAYLAKVASTRPQLLVLDDLHAADSASLLLLQFVARAARDLPLLLVGTHRDAEVRANREVERALANAGREGIALALGGLDLVATTQLVATVTGAAVTTELAETIHRTTDGNPFFVEEVARTLGAERRTEWMRTGAEATLLPDRVRAAVQRRLDTVAPTTLDALAVGAIVGIEFSARIVADVLEVPIADALERVDDACQQGLTHAVSEHQGRYRFRHTLVRDVLYEATARPRRARLHGAVGRSIEAHSHTLGIRAEEIVPALASHFYHAALVSDDGRAVSYGLRAAELAMSRCAYEEAVTRCRRTLELVEANDPQRGELLLLLAAAARAAGAGERADDALEQVAQFGRRHRHAPLLLRSGLEGVPDVDGYAVDPVRVARLEEGIGHVNGSNAALRARGLARLAWELYWTGNRDRCATLANEALAIARRLDDKATLAYVLTTRRYALWGPEDVGARLDTSEELLQLGRETGSFELLAEGHHWRIVDLLGLGQIAALDRELAAYEQVATLVRRPRFTWWLYLWRAMRSTITGEFTKAQEEIAIALASGERANARNATLAMYGGMMGVLWQTGQLAHLGELGRMGATADGHDLANDPHMRAGTALIQAELGQTEPARGAFESLAQPMFSGISPAIGSESSLACLAMACAFLGDAPRAEVLAERLHPYRDRVIVTGPALATFGPGARLLGLLAATRGRWDEAEHHLEKSLGFALRMTSPPFIARTQADWAGVLLARGRTVDRDRARELAGAAAESAEQLGMTLVAARAAAVVADLEGSVSTRPAVVQRASGEESGILRREGEFWTFHYRDHTIRVRATTGVSYLAQIMQHPWQEFHALDLASRDGQDRGADRGDAGDILDPQARREYRARLSDLDGEIAAAEDRNDLGGLEALREERHALARALAAAFGLGGRSRRAGSPTENARISVTRAIQRVLSRVAEDHPALGEHLRHTVRTGTYCVYRPDPRLAISWQG